MLAARLAACLAGTLLIALLTIHLLALHEGPGWVSPLVLGDHLFDVALAGVMLLYALVIGRTLAAPLLGLEQDTLLESLAAIALGLGISSQAILMMGFLRLYYGIAFLAAFVALTCWLRLELLRAIIQIWAAARRWIRAGLPTAPTLGQRLVLLVLLLTFASVFLRSLVPLGGADADWDALAYHQAAPRIYIALHRYVPLPDIQLSNAPAGEQMLLIPGLLAGTDGLEKVLNLAFALLVGLAIYAIGRRHFGTRAGWLGGLLFFNTIWLIPIIPAALLDFAAAFLLILGIGDMLAWAARAGTRAARAERESARLPISIAREDRLLLRAGLLIGLSASFKLITLPALPAVAGVVLLGAPFLKEGGLSTRLLHAIRGATVFCSAALAGLAIWLIKSKYFFGSFLYPVSVQAANNAGASGGAGPTHRATLAAPDHLAIIEHAWLVITSVAQLAWQFTSPLCLLLLLGPVVLRRPAERAALLFLAIGSALWLTFDVLFIPPRYWMGLVALCDVVVAGIAVALATRLSVRPRYQRMLCAVVCYVVIAYWLSVIPLSQPTVAWTEAVVAALAVLTISIAAMERRQRERISLLELPIVCFLIVNSVFGLFLELRQLDRSRAIAVVTGQVSRAAYLQAYAQPYAAEAYVQAHVPRTAQIVLVGITRGGYLDRPYLADWYGSRRALLADPTTRTAEIARWCDARVGYAVVNRGSEDPAGGRVRPRSAFPWLRTPGLNPRVLFSANGIDVLAVNPCAATRWASRQRHA